MQQLNVLPIKVSQNVETKDDTAVSTSSSSKEDFSKHIDVHLTKDKDARGSASNKSVEKQKVQTDKVSSNDKVIIKDNDVQENKVVNSSDKSENLVDDKSSANDEPEFAASGKDNEVEPSKIAKGEKPDILNDSEQLMSFLTKIDKTLVDTTTSVDAGSNKTSKDESIEKLLQKSAGSSEETKNVALESSDEEGTSNKEGENSKSSVSSKNSKESVENIQQKSELLSNSNNAGVHSDEGDSVSEESTSPNDNKNVNVQSNAAKANEGSSEDILIKNQKNADTIGNRDIQPADENNVDGKLPNQTGIDNGKMTRKGLEQQNSISANNNAETNKNEFASKSSMNSQTANNEQGLSESKVNDQIEKLKQNESVTSKIEPNLKPTTEMNQNTNNNSSTKSSGKSVVENLVKESISVDKNIQTDPTAIDNLAEQSKELNSSESKSVNVKEQPKVSTAFANYSGASDILGKASQAYYDKIDQHSAEILNPIGSSEVSQSQKSNTQLHQETISIFRRDFADAVKDKVMLMISQKLQQFDITLDPPELGNMQVRVNLQGEQASVNFVVQNQQAKESLEQNMHKLKEMLAEQGVDVGDSNVEQQSQQSDMEESKDDSQKNVRSNTADASDVTEHNLTTIMNNSSAKVIDYYA